jgi:hypothetical protein
MVVAKLVPDYAGFLILMCRLNCAGMVQKVIRIRRTDSLIIFRQGGNTANSCTVYRYDESVECDTLRACLFVIT